jgi:hypothetical protein
VSIVIRDQTPCGICGRPLRSGESLECFSAFVPNELDPLYVFSDGAFHKSCFNADPRGRAARDRFDTLRVRTGPGHRVCVVCAGPIDLPDEYFSFGFVADHPDRLRALNYLQFHRSHLPIWPGLQEASDALTELEQSGAWKGGGLRWLLNQLESAIEKSNAASSQ